MSHAPDFRDLDAGLAGKCRSRVLRALRPEYGISNLDVKCPSFWLFAIAAGILNNVCVVLMRSFQTSGL